MSITYIVQNTKALSRRQSRVRWWRFRVWVERFFWPYTFRYVSCLAILMLVLLIVAAELLRRVQG